MGYFQGGPRFGLEIELGAGFLIGLAMAPALQLVTGSLPSGLGPGVVTSEGGGSG